MNAFRIAVLGVGVVGRATLEALLRDRDRLAERAGREIEVGVVAARTPRRLDGLALAPGTLVTADPAEAAGAAAIDCVVELMGGLSPAAGVLREALGSGRSVVSANKHLLAAEGPALEALAHQASASLRFEAAVGGGTPVLRVCAADLAGVRIERVRGVVNGTTNWILDAMEQDGLGFDEALVAAQAAGYAEADPAFDVEGIDAADKLVVLARLAFGRWIAPGAVVRHAIAGPGAGRPGITGVDVAAIRAAAGRGRRIRLVAEATRGERTIEASVRPRELALDDPLAAARGIGNVVVFEGGPLGAVTVAGPGAGGPATAAAVIADIVALARGEGSTWDASPLEHAVAVA